MNNKHLILVIALLSFSFIACDESSPIKTERDTSKSVSNVPSDENTLNQTGDEIEMLIKETEGNEGEELPIGMQKESEEERLKMQKALELGQAEMELSEEEIEKLDMEIRREMDNAGKEASDAELEARASATDQKVGVVPAEPLAN